jgi:hypothetical protein
MGSEFYADSIPGDPQRSTTASSSKFAQEMAEFPASPDSLQLPPASSLV